MRFYFVGILFIIFDLEIAFLFSLGIASLDLPLIGVLGVYFFLFVLIVGLVYGWAEGGLKITPYNKLKTLCTYIVFL